MIRNNKEINIIMNNCIETVLTCKHHCRRMGIASDRLADLINNNLIKHHGKFLIIGMVGSVFTAYP